MADDLTARLREKHPFWWSDDGVIYCACGRFGCEPRGLLDRIEALEAERDAALADVAKLREALTEIWSMAERWPAAWHTNPEFHAAAHIARAVLSNAEEAKSDG